MRTISPMMKYGNKSFVLRYHELVFKNDIPLLDAPWRVRIEKAILEKLSSQPELFGIPLRQSLKGYRKLRIGDYRVIFKITETTVFIITIQHRSIVYKALLARIKRL